MDFTTLMDWMFALYVLVHVAFIACVTKMYLRVYRNCVCLDD